MEHLIMKKEVLSARAVEHAKPDPTKRLEIPAGPPTGLYLTIQTTGSKSWSLRYRYRGRPRKLTLPKGYPELKLAGARAEAQAHLDELKEDRDPAVVQAQEIAEAAPSALKSVVDEYIKRYADKH